MSTPEIISPILITTTDGKDVCRFCKVAYDHKSEVHLTWHSSECPAYVAFRDAIAEGGRPRLALRLAARAHLRKSHTAPPTDAEVDALLTETAAPDGRVRYVAVGFVVERHMDDGECSTVAHCQSSEDTIAIAALLNADAIKRPRERKPL